MGRIGKSTGKGRTSREGLKLLERRRLAFERWRGGESLSEIAAAIHSTKQTVWLDIQLALNDWREAHRGSVNEHVEHELRRLNRLELRAEQKLDGIPEDSLEGSDWARVMLECIRERRRLLGVDAPARSEIKADVTVSRTFKPKEEMLQEVRREIEQLRSRRAADN